MNILKPVAITDERTATILKRIVGSSAWVLCSSAPRWKKKLMLLLSEKPVTGPDLKDWHRGMIVLPWEDREGSEREITYGTEDGNIIQFHYFGEETFKVSAGGDTVPFMTAGEEVWPAIAFASALGLNLMTISKVFTEKKF